MMEEEEEVGDGRSGGEGVGVGVAVGAAVEHEHGGLTGGGLADGPCRGAARQCSTRLVPVKVCAPLPPPP